MTSRIKVKEMKVINFCSFICYIVIKMLFVYTPKFLTYFVHLVIAKVFYNHHLTPYQKLNNTKKSP